VHCFDSTHLHLSQKVYDARMKSDLKLNFEELISSDTRVMVVNPLDTYWSYFLTAETAARAAKRSNNVTWINLACRQKRRFEINAGDNLPQWRFRNTGRALEKVFESLRISCDTSFTKLAKADVVPIFHSIKELREFQVGEMRVGALIFSGIASAMRSTGFTLEEAEPYINHFFRYTLNSIERLRKVISQINPDLILTTNDRLISSSAALAIAGELGIPSRVVYWGSSVDKLQDYFASLYDSDEWQDQVKANWQRNSPVQRDVELLQNEIQNLSKGPSADSMTYLSLQEPGKSFSMNARTAVFFAQSEHEHSPNFIANDKRRFKTQYDAFTALQTVTKDCGWNLILKYHPLKNNADIKQKHSKPGLDWEEIHKLDHVTEISSDSDIDTYSLIEDSTLNIVWSSTVGLESISRERPTLVLGNPHWLNKEWAIHAWTEDDLKDFFSRPIHVIPSESLYPWFWYLKDYGSSVEYFKLVGSSFSYHGKKIVAERPLIAILSKVFRFFAKTRKSK
jgi:hypothetical protein